MHFSYAATLIQTGGGETFKFSFQDGSGTNNVSIPNFWTPGKLYHVAVTIASTGKIQVLLCVMSRPFNHLDLQVFKNGAQVGASTGNSAPPRVIRSKTWLGKSTNAGGQFNGTLHSFSIYPRVLSKTEISLLSTTGAGDHGFHIQSAAGATSHYVFEGSNWALMEEYASTTCESDKILVRGYFKRDTCYVQPESQKKSFMLQKGGLQFYIDDLCINKDGLIRSYEADKCVSGQVANQGYKMKNWDVYTVDDTMNSLLRKVYVPGWRFHKCGGPYYVEQWHPWECRPASLAEDGKTWRKEVCLNNAQRNRQDYLDSACTIIKDHDPTMRNLLGRCKQEGDKNMYFWDFGCDYMYQERHAGPHESEMSYHGEMRDCAMHPHREKTCLMT